MFADGAVILIRIICEKDYQVRASIIYFEPFYKKINQILKFVIYIDFSLSQCIKEFSKHLIEKIFVPLSEIVFFVKNMGSKCTSSKTVFVASFLPCFCTVSLPSYPLAPLHAQSSAFLATFQSNPQTPTSNESVAKEYA